MPTFGAWSEAARFMARLRGDYGEQDRLLRQCAGWWAEYKQKLGAQIENFVADTRVGDAGPAVRKYRSFPGIQTVELLRHHTVPAVFRRVRRQVVRLFKNRKLRVTPGL